MNATPRPSVRHRVEHRGGGVAARNAPALILLALLSLLLLPMFGGCTAEEKYKVLSFFFDGVPDPNAPAAVAGEEGEDGTRAILARSFAHQPYAENNCGACHDNATGSYSDFQKLDNSVCLRCHEGVTTSYPRMHGPVSLGECNLCHVPHESAVVPLLIDQPAKLCSTCHVRELLPAEPADHMTDRSCLDCHMGHGGSERGLLRDGWNQPPAPDAGESTTRPAELQDSPPPPGAAQGVAR